MRELLSEFIGDFEYEIESQVGKTVLENFMFPHRRFKDGRRVKCIFKLKLNQRPFNGKSAHLKEWENPEITEELAIKLHISNQQQNLKLMPHQCCFQCSKTI